MLCELMVSTIQINEGEEKEKVVKSWSGKTEMIIANALGAFDKSGKMIPASSGRGIRRFV